MGKRLRLREVKNLGQSHTATDWLGQSGPTQTLNQGSQGPGPEALSTHKTYCGVCAYGHPASHVTCIRTSTRRGPSRPESPAGTAPAAGLGQLLGTLTRPQSRGRHLCGHEPGQVLDLGFGARGLHRGVDGLEGGGHGLRQVHHADEDLRGAGRAAPLLTYGGRGSGADRPGPLPRGSGPWGGRGERRRGAVRCTMHREKGGRAGGHIKELNAQVSGSYARGPVCQELRTGHRP